VRAYGSDCHGASGSGGGMRPSVDAEPSAGPPPLSEAAFAAIALSSAAVIGKAGTARFNCAPSPEPRATGKLGNARRVKDAGLGDTAVVAATTGPGCSSVSAGNGRLGLGGVVGRGGKLNTSPSYALFLNVSPSSWT
jgi:hypothetical protein